MNTPNHSEHNEVNNTSQDVFLTKPIEKTTTVINEEGKTPFINGSSTIQIEGKQEPLALNDKCDAYQYGDKVVVVFRSPDNPPKEKVYLKENNDIYINIFEATNEHQKNDKIRFNHNFFKKSGNVVISQLYETNERKQMQKLFFNDTVYELDNPESEAGFGDSNYKLAISDKKLYALWGASREVLFYDFARNPSTSINTFPINDTFFLLKGKHNALVTDKSFTLNSKKVKTITENGIQWKNSVEDINWHTKVEHNDQNVWLWNGKECIIDDKKITLPKETEIRDVAVSSTGNCYAIVLKASQYGGKYWGEYFLLLQKDNEPPKEIVLGKKQPYALSIDNQGNYAYYEDEGHYEGEDKNSSIHFNTYQKPFPKLDMNWDGGTVITFAKDGELYIEYVDSFTQETKKELMTLNPAAAEIIQEKENAEKKAEERGKIATFLEQNDITTLEQLTAIATAAKRVPQLEKQLQSKEGELETSNLLLEQNKEKLQQELKNLTKKYQELQQEMNKIKHGISKGTFGYKIDNEARRILGIK